MAEPAARPEPAGNCPECGECQPSGFQLDGWIEIRADVVSYQPCPACRVVQHAAWRNGTSPSRQRQRR